MENVFEIPERYATKIYESNDWIILEQQIGADAQKIIIHKYDLQDIIDALCDIAGIGNGRP